MLAQPVGTRMKSLFSLHPRFIRVLPRLNEIFRNLPHFIADPHPAWF